MASKINKNKVIAAAQKYVQKGQYDKAIREYTRIVEEDPRDVRIWLKIGDLHAKKNAKPEAVETYSKVAEFYSEQGFYLKSVAVYKQILKIDSSLVEINLRLAELYKQLGLLSDAMQQYEQVSNHYHQSGRTREALAALRQIVELDPENVASRIKLAELYSKESMRDEAVEEFAKAADYLRAENRIDDFVKVAERLVFHQSDNIAIVKELAGIYLRKRDARRALQKLQLAFKSDPRDTETLEMLARAFEDLGQVAKTVSVLKEVANVYAENGQTNKQRETFQRIVNLSPNDEDAHRFLGQPAPQAATQQPAFEPQPPPPQGPAPSGFDDFSKPVEEYTGPVDAGQADPAFGAPIAARTTGPPYPQPSEEYFPGDYEADQPDHYEAPEHLDEDVFNEPFEELQDGAGWQEDYGEGAAFPPPEAPGAYPDFQAEVAKIITEADVYLKYGLQEKAIDHLLQVFDTDPHNLDVHLKLREIYVQMGRYRDAARELYILGQMYSEADRRQAAEFLNEALELDPDNREARMLLGTLEGSLPEAPTPYDLGDDEVEPIDLDAADIVEEIPIDSADLLEASSLTPMEPGGADGSMPESGAGEESLLETGSVGGQGLESGGAGALESDVDAPEGASTEPGRGWPTDRAHLASQVEFNEESVYDTLSGTEDEPGSGIIEVQGETIDTLGTGTPASEVIELGGQPRRSDSQARAHLEEESPKIEDDLEEAEFFIQQNLLTEARGILEELAARAPNHPLVRGKLAELETLERGGGEVEEDVVDEEPTNLAKELEFDDVEEFDLPEDEANFSVEDVFEEFKRGSGDAGSEEDSDTHYDLGIAYREMGLLDDAITEFKDAMRSRDKEVLCHMMIGLCYIEKDMLSEAISQFKTGLYVEGITERETIALYFELGQAYEHLEDYREALYYYEKVVKKDARFREVGKRIEEIQTKEGRSQKGKNPGDDRATPSKMV